MGRGGDGEGLRCNGEGWRWGRVEMGRGGDGEGWRWLHSYSKTNLTCIHVVVLVYYTFSGSVFTPYINIRNMNVHNVVVYTCNIHSIRRRLLCGWYITCTYIHVHVHSVMRKNQPEVQVYTCTCTYIHVYYTCTCTYMYMYVCTCIFSHEGESTRGIYMYMYIHIHVHSVRGCLRFL